MQTGKRGLKLIKSFEGLELKAYKDVVGVWTIGYGSTHYVKEGQELANEEAAEELLAKDLTQYENVVNRAVRVQINQNQFDALVSFTYNLGGGALRKSTLLKKINREADYLQIKKEFLRWNRAGGRVLNGLVRRRKAEAKLFGEKV